MNRTRAFFQLVRAPNLCTAAADVWAGFLFAGAAMGELTALAYLTGASVCFYAGGVALNDVLDARRDAVERAGRPIPSGRISRGTAALVAIALLACGCALSAMVSYRAQWIGIALLGCIVLYDAVLKRTAAAPAVMGMCRAANLLLGMSVADAWDTPANLFAAGLMWLYVSSVTLFARHEASQSSRRSLRAAAVGVSAAVAGLIGVQAFLAEADTWYLLLVGVLLGQVVVPARRAVSTGAPADVQRAVHVFVSCVVLFDACLVFASRGPLLAAPVLLLLVPTIALGRIFRIT